MYDNIVMSEFTYADDHKESNTTIPITHTSWFSKLKNNNDSNLIQSSPALLADLSQKLEHLMPAENSFSYKRTLKPIPIMDVHFSFLKAKSLCLAGVRSRYESNSNINTFTIRVIKAGIIDRKYELTQGGKRATARSWRPFGVILSGSQIIFFADTSSFQNWLEETPPRRNNSFPTLTSSSASLIPTTESSDNFNSLASGSSHFTQKKTNTTQSIPNNVNSSFSHTHSYLRPVQIISLSYAVCIYDEEYTKYPHVFRLITGDGQQFLFRTEDDKEMEDWMLKINYAATLKTTGIRMRPITTMPSLAKRSFSSSGYSNLANQQKYADRLKREMKANEKVEELTIRIDEQVKLLDRELQLRRNLMVLTPYIRPTRDRILAFADSVGKRIKSKRIELQRLQCYRDFLECELAWCHSQNEHQKQQKLRKMSLPLPSHSSDAYSVTDNNTKSSHHAIPLTEKNKGTVKRSSDIVTTAPSTSSTSLSSALSSSTISSGQHLLDDTLSAISGNEEEEDNDSQHESERIASHHDTASYHDILPTSQPPAFKFPKSIIDGLFSFTDSEKKKKNVKVVVTKPDNNEDVKETGLKQMIRRRSQSNPIFPNSNNKKILSFLELSPIRRQRSGSEASSVQADDDYMSVVIVNDQEESPNDQKDE
ncbi:uncharacterized protein BX663DRAFT_321041 [Cokeromyces recurvatus]|uniref:uncharacterized protein n=1 Tax=Cokeromyces recurvatus TaxID=90255 RepID=UPI00221ED8F3|nr:uncharacterized protein BX663DRAFT_321041 [Cokeromyces recurvatus]KAI7904561.1 hypothetical protein BX663DRAFT_321041 [Cokeromyces recurvatus]